MRCFFKTGRNQKLKKLKFTYNVNEIGKILKMLFFSSYIILVIQNQLPTYQEKTSAFRNMFILFKIN